MDWSGAEDRAVKALERNRLLIEASAIDEAREYRPPKAAPAYKPKPNKRGRRRSKRQPPISASELPRQVERLREHFNGARPTQ